MTTKTALRTTKPRSIPTSGQRQRTGLTQLQMAETLARTLNAIIALQRTTQEVADGTWLAYLTMSDAERVALFETLEVLPRQVQMDAGLKGRKIQAADLL